MTPPEQDVLDRLIEEGLSLYGQGDLDGALVVWERVLAQDPQNALATSYVDYVRTNYETLTAESQEAGEGVPLPLASDSDPGYVIEVIPGEEPKPGTPIALASDDVDAGWDDEAVDDKTLDLAAARPDALQLEPLAQAEDTFDDATSEYDPRMRVGEDTFTAHEQTSIRRRELGFVRPAEDFEPPTREHRSVRDSPGRSAALRDGSLDLDAQATVRTPAGGEPTRDLNLATAPTRDLPGTLDALVSAPTRELGLRQLALQPTELHDTGETRATRADVVLPFDPIDARAAQILAAVDEGSPADEPVDERTRRRITALVERAASWSAAGDLDRAVAAVDLALAEDPNTAIAQKLIQRNRETIMQVFQAFLGDLARQPVLARPLHELASAPISPRAAFLLSRVDGSLSIDEVLDVSGMPRMEAYRYLCQLFLRGILR